MDIAICTDCNYIMPCGIMLYSICKNNKDEHITFHIIIDESVKQDDKNSLEEIVSTEPLKTVLFYLIQGSSFNYYPRLDKTNPKNHITKAAYYRLLLPKIIPENIDKILYLDCDIIVRHSLKDLWNTELANKSIAVIPDVAEGIIDKYNRLRYPQTKGYFNSGVILINLRKWRKDNVFLSFNQFIHDHPDWIKLHDQDILNRIFYDDKINLPIKYNFQEGYLWNDLFYDYWKYEKQVLAARKDPVIIHYTDSKPWIEGCEHPFKAEFYKYQKNTEWKYCSLLKKEPLPNIRKRIKEIIKKILRYIGIIAPSPVYPPKYINIDNL